jgi:tetratricopeptide (TPR) repeat protein
VAPWILALLLAGLTATVYWPVSGHPFLPFDDDKFITGNRFIRGGLSVASVRWAFTTLHLANWHPVTWVSHLLDVTLFGLAPGPHHLESVFWHAAAAGLLLAFLRAVTGRLLPSFVVAALFALHPLHVESVAWVTERKDLVSGVFWMLALWLYVRYARKPGAGLYLAVLGSFALALMSKPMVVTLPVVLLVLDVWPFGRHRVAGAGGAGGSRLAALRTLLVEKIPLFLMSAATSVAAIVAQSRAGTPVPLENFPLTVRVGNALTSIATYLLKAFWPQPLAIYYPHPGHALPGWRITGAALLVLALAVAATRSFRRRPFLACGLLWYVVSLLPVAGLVQVGAQGMADRYTYLPLVGVFVAVVWGAREFAPGWPHRRAVLGLAAAAALVSLSLVTRSYLALWKDPRTLFTHAAAVVPGNWLMHYNLGVIAGSRGEIAEAIRQYAECTRVRPDFADAWSNLGQLQAFTGHRAEAKESLLNALRLKPDLAEAHFNLALIYLREREPDKALERYRLLRSIGSVYAEPLLKMISTPAQGRP